MTAVRWGFWGTGRISHDVASDLQGVPGATLQAVASRTLAQAQAFARLHGAPNAHAGLAALLRDDTVDIVYVASPSYCHVEDALACIEAGKAVMCEKPLAMCAADARRLADAAREHGVFCMEAMWSRFLPAVMALRDQVRQGALGPIHLITMDFAYPSPSATSASATAASAADARGAVLLDRGVYSVSIANFLLGAVPEQAVAARPTAGAAAQRTCAFDLHYPSGTQVRAWSSADVQGSNQLWLHGERGSACLPAPFYKADRLQVQRITPASSLSTALVRGGRDSPGKRRLRDMHRRLAWLPRAVSAARQARFPFQGHGYQFELAEASRLVAAGARESATMPLADSIAVLDVTDRLLAQWWGQV